MTPYPGMKNTIVKGLNGRAPGEGETLQKNPDGKRPVVGGNTFVVVEADGDDLVHSDGKAAAKAVELLEKYEGMKKPFWLGVGFVPTACSVCCPQKILQPIQTVLKNGATPERYPGTGMIFHRLESIIVPAKTCRWIFVNKRRRLADTTLPLLI
jgi:hypothetical protein